MDMPILLCFICHWLMPWWFKLLLPPLSHLIFCLFSLFHCGSKLSSQFLVRITLESSDARPQQSCGNHVLLSRNNGGLPCKEKSCYRKTVPHFIPKMYIHWQQTLVYLFIWYCWLYRKWRDYKYWDVENRLTK